MTWMHWPPAHVMSRAGQVNRWVRGLISEHLIRTANTGFWQHPSFTMFAVMTVIGWLTGRNWRTATVVSESNGRSS